MARRSNTRQSARLVEGPGPRCTLIVSIDDATGRLVGLRHGGGRPGGVTFRFPGTHKAFELANPNAELLGRLTLAQTMLQIRPDKVRSVPLRDAD